MNFKIDRWSITNKPIIEEYVVKIAVFNRNKAGFLKVYKRICMFMLIEIVDDTPLNELIKNTVSRKNYINYQLRNHR